MKRISKSRHSPVKACPPTVVLVRVTLRLVTVFVPKNQARPKRRKFCPGVGGCHHHHQASQAGRGKSTLLAGNLNSRQARQEVSPIPGELSAWLAWWWWWWWETPTQGQDLGRLGHPSVVPSILGQNPKTKFRTWYTFESAAMIFRPFFCHVTLGAGFPSATQLTWKFSSPDLFTMDVCSPVTISGAWNTSR